MFHPWAQDLPRVPDPPAGHGPLLHGLSDRSDGQRHVAICCEQISISPSSVNGQSHVSGCARTESLASVR